MRVGREGDGGVPQLAGLLAARDARQDRAEERDAVDVDGGGADVVTDGVHAGVVAATQRLVVLVGGGGLRQLGGQAHLLERLRDHLVEVLVVLVVDPGAHRGVERRQDLGALELLGGDRDADRAPGLLHHLLVFLGQVPALVEDRQAHHVELHLDVTHLLHFENPARGDPAPRAQRVEPETCDILLSHQRVLSTTGRNSVQHNCRRARGVPTHIRRRQTGRACTGKSQRKARNADSAPIFIEPCFLCDLRLPPLQKRTRAL
ncbi:hypothetical protein MSMEI_4571 [Mycolicibacterium smegmatis MC2 155]|uniref:Uncharacterized protein n=1 Tax=Mycolicibacterium smegmatis (strain ATCC 700084 / mc(2)155) TaxID=246196 RepID=I7FQK5_MYCS2|nr:hypothetical protein MSMEI_4571 [Mycolicibacterium smegmatis MC2 155]